MASYLLRGILIGVLFGLPVGAVGTMTVQRVWSFGFRAGLLTGLGSSAADCLYAVVGAFGLTLISEFLLQYQIIIKVLGGGFIIFMGISLILKKEEAVGTQERAAGGVKMFLSSFVIGIANPAAILTFLFAFTYFGISGAAEAPEGILLVIGIFLGTYLWWMVLSAAACVIKKNIGSVSLLCRNKVFGGILAVFGTAVFLAACSSGGGQNQSPVKAPPVSTKASSEFTETEMESGTESTIVPEEQQIPTTQPTDNTVSEDSAVTKMNVQVGENSFTATLESNSAVDALAAMLQDAPIVLSMSDYSGFEKVGSLGTSLPASNSQITAQAGDIVLYNGDQIVILYGSNSWSYTRLGKIDDLSGWESALGGGEVTVTFSLD